MKNILLFFMLIYDACCVAAMNPISDPFSEPTIRSCDEWAEDLRKQLVSWRFKGSIHSAHKEVIPYQQIWFINNHQQWLTMRSPVVPLELQPWHILSMTASTIVWKAILPEYCQSPLLIHMRLGEE